MQRKEFIKKASLLAGSVTMASLSKGYGMVAAPVYSNGLNLKKGLGYGMIKENLPLMDKFLLARDLGFNGIEFNSPVEFTVKELVDARDKSGIELPSVVN
ncbi:MAG TPA: hypothetical protein PKA53_14130, partial [Sphingobacterium sp.]|nr:hypothetical protein [Sphingobacterium sp.]